MPRPTRKIGAPSVFTLALWQLRRTKWMLCIVELGILAAVVFVCAALIYSQITVTAGLHSDLQIYPAHASISVNASVDRPFLERLQLANTTVNTITHAKLSTYLDHTQERFSISTGLLSLLSKPQGAVTLKDSNNQPIIDDIVLNGADTLKSASHLHVVQGRLPQNSSQSHSDTNTVIEVAVTSQTESSLHLVLGSLLKTEIDVVQNEQLLKSGFLSLKVVGIIQAPTESDLYWNHTLFNPVKQSPDQAKSAFTYYAMTSNNALISTLEQFVPTQYEPGQASAGTSSDDSGDVTLVPPLQASWLYSLNANVLEGTNLGLLINTLQSFQGDSVANPALNQKYGLANIQTLVPVTALQSYQDEIAVSQIPALGLILVIFLLLLYFISLMTDLLVERQAGSIAILRSRGASRWQVFSALLLQGCILTLLALIIGPILSLWVSRWMALLLLSAQDQVAIDIVLRNGRQVILSVFWYVVVMMLFVLLILVIAINRTTALDVLAIRWDASRSTRRPLWLRWNFDIMAVVITVLGYGISFYLLSTDVLDARLRLLLLSPLILARTIFTILAGVLLFLRFFPTLLRFGSWLTTRRGSGAASMVSLAQLARSPRQSIRMTMLLSLATAFSMFALIFYASQLQRAQDVAAHSVGADFDATLPAKTGIVDLPGVLSLYGHLPGVLGASAGSSGNTLLLGDQHVSINILAVDASTYAQTANWPTDNSTQAVASLMQQLVADRSNALDEQQTPALIDASMASTYHLRPGAKFSLSDASDSSQTFYFKVLAIVSQIPAQSTPDGILIDVKSYAAAYQRVYGRSSPVPFQLNTVWLRTTDNPTDLKTIRAALSTGTTQMLDRRQLIDNLHQEPLYLQVMGVLLLGPAIALMLILIGNLVASWISARDRLTNFALLRALGAAPRTIANTLIWEQVIVYATSIILGVVFGGFLSWMVVPSLLFTSSSGQPASDDVFFFSQSIPPIQIIIPALLVIGLVLLIAICILALGMMVRVVSKPSMAMTLRLNED